MKTAYFDANGHLLILAQVIVGSDMTPPPGAEHMRDVADEVGPNDIYLDLPTGELRVKDAFPITVARNLISGVPAGTRALFMDGGDETIDDGTVEFVADVEATEFVTLSHPHHIMQEVAVETGP
jgi:hypothetical protein